MPTVSLFHPAPEPPEREPYVPPVPSGSAFGGAIGLGEGGVEPWRRCYREVGSKLVFFARQILQSDSNGAAEDAEDVVQTAFVRFWKAHPEAQPEHYGLLFAAVRTAALDVLRSCARRYRREDAYSTEVRDVRDAAAVSGGRDSWFEVPSDRQAEADRVQAALQKLPPEQREVIVLKIWGEFTFAEIANSLNESPNTVASRYRLGIGSLKRHLSSFNDLR